MLKQMSNDSINLDSYETIQDKRKETKQVREEKVGSWSYVRECMGHLYELLLKLNVCISESFVIDAVNSSMQQNHQMYYTR